MSHENSSAPVGGNCDLPTLGGPLRLKNRMYGCFGCSFRCTYKDDIEKHTNEWCRELCQYCNRIKYIMIIDGEELQMCSGKCKYNMGILN